MKLGVLFYKFVDSRMLESEKVIPFIFDDHVVDMATIHPRGK